MASDGSTGELNPPLPKPSGSGLSGRVVVVTGGTQGLGLEIARHLKALGAAGLVLVSRSHDKGRVACDELSDGQSCRVVFVSADLSRAEEAAGVIPRAAELMKGIGPVTGLVNAAATTDRGNLFTTTAESFDLQFAINVRAPFLITQAAAMHMVAEKVRGTIVNICSVASHGGAPFVMAYSCAKSALVTLTKNNAAELSSHGIRVNGINMGWCVTENEDKLQRKNSGDDWVEKADQTVPLGRILRPADVAATVAFLLSGSSVMMTGEVLNLHPEFQHGMLSMVDDDTDGAR